MVQPSGRPFKRSSSFSMHGNTVHVGSLNARGFLPLSVELESLDVERASRVEAHREEADEEHLRRALDDGLDLDADSHVEPGNGPRKSLHTHAIFLDTLDQEAVEAVEAVEGSPGEEKAADAAAADGKRAPPPGADVFAICMMVIGTHGEVCPFLVIAVELQRRGHRVRVAALAQFRSLVEAAGVEFYPLAGNAEQLAGLAARSRGVLPSGPPDSRELEAQLQAVVLSTWAACTEADPAGAGRPFRATAIIANPPVYGHVTCAEKLQVPLHIMFTMPWTPTAEFSHPMALLYSVNVSGGLDVGPKVVAGLTNWYSFVGVSAYSWLGVRGPVGALRKQLELQDYGAGTHPAHAAEHLAVPVSYLWSPALQPRPKDWGRHIEVCGFALPPDAAGCKEYEPPSDLVQFLAGCERAGQRPIYVGFGSMVLEQPRIVTAMVFDAAAQTGQRVLLARGWAKLGACDEPRPRHVHLVDHCPHSFIFPRCSAAIHHGGAGTTAAGLAAGLPTFVVPVFADQTFWGRACERAGVGPGPVGIDRVTTDTFKQAFKTLRADGVRARAAALAAKLKEEAGAKAAADHFLRMLHSSPCVPPRGGTCREGLPAGIRVNDLMCGTQAVCSSDTRMASIAMEASLDSVDETVTCLGPRRSRDRAPRDRPSFDWRRRLSLGGRRSAEDGDRRVRRTQSRVRWKDTPGSVSPWRAEVSGELAKGRWKRKSVWRGRGQTWLRFDSASSRDGGDGDAQPAPTPWLVQVFAPCVAPQAAE